MTAVHLTPREEDVLQLVARGHTHKQIGLELGISPRTAKQYTTSIRSKAGVKSKSLLTGWAQDWLRAPERA